MPRVLVDGFGFQLPGQVEWPVLAQSRFNFDQFLSCLIFSHIYLVSMV
ncbi:hypothetical protein HCH_00637 [Hahella chejuensis KCTC 2396]|uniref:Uncharacterized protein n=1 Tax=Hahella chejuensis (strain KCTC 2396) TaxID=349521 RepID=Q2SP86_HAHCH|nr:hypothetical protein HCH_00637 [Hahella chejuensis KCTC 2396]